MKRYKLLTATVLLGAALATSACDEGLAEINENPNAPTDVPAQFLLPQVERSAVEQILVSWFSTEFTTSFTQHTAKIQYTDEDQYRLRENVITGWWSSFYAGDMKDWQTIIDKGVATERINHQAIGMIGKVYTTHFMTDVWGDIPYSQALQGDTEEPITAPSYDTQEAVFTAMLDELATAASMLDPARTSFGAEDIIYGGDVTLWRKFANSLRLRLAMRMSDVAPSVARPIVESLASSGDLILTNADNAMFPFLSATPNQHPLHENWKTRDDHATSNTMINMMGALADPRIELYADPAQVPDETRTFAWCDEAGEPVCHVTYNGNVYRGMRNGVNSGDVPEPLGLWSRIGTHWRGNGADTPGMLMTAAEVHFMLAEAAERGWDVGPDAQTHYETAIAAAFAMYDGAEGVDLGPGVAAAYMAQPGVAYGSTPVDGAGGNLELIAEQKWLALWMNGPEAYAEMRRTGYPDEVMPSMDAAISYVPGRIPYPDSEQSLNSANLDEAISRQGNDGLYGGTLWWDTTPQ